MPLKVAGSRSMNLSGLRFGSLTALVLVGHSPGKARMAIWMCRCDCGVEKTFYSNALRSGGTKSCGCQLSGLISSARRTHGMSHSREFFTWKGMIARCHNPADPYYSTYGGRGIHVCERWRDSFENFYADMGMRPENMTLDRKDGELGYSLENCRWATKEEQALNRKTTIQLQLGGETVSRREAARRIGISAASLRRWLLLGLTPDEVAAKTSMKGKKLCS